MRRDYPEFTRREAEVVAIGPEDAASFAAWWRRKRMPFPGIPDPRHVIATAYGQQVKLLKLGRMPALFVVDRDGRMRFRHFGDSMSDITTDEEVLSLLDEINGEKETAGR